MLGCPRGSGRDWLRSAIARLTATAVEISDGRRTYGGNLLEFYRDEDTSRTLLEITPKLAPFFGPSQWTQGEVLDAHGNTGFSGGPVVFATNGQPGNLLHVAGVVSYYPVPLLQPIVDREGEPFTNPAGEAIGYVQENPRIVVAIAIRHVVELIDANPIGFPLPAE